jgi:hypothetical protein
MIVEEFNFTHFDKFNPNRLSEYKELLGFFYADEVIKYSLIVDDEVMAIIVFYPYCQNNWTFFVLFSCNFKSIYLKSLKKFYTMCLENIKPDKIITDSVDIEFNNKMHKLFGLELEGTRKRHMYGKDINMWGATWE